MRETDGGRDEPATSRVMFEGGWMPLVTVVTNATVEPALGWGLHTSVGAPAADPEAAFQRWRHGLCPVRQQLKI